MSLTPQSRRECAWRVIEKRRNLLQSVSESVQKVDLRWGATVGTGSHPDIPKKSACIEYFLSLQLVDDL
jgi:hypothetical protein